MTPDDFYRARDDRQLRYAGRVLDFTRVIAVTASPDFLGTAAGQAAAIALANVLSRMGRRVRLAFFDVELHGALGCRSRSLVQHCLSIMQSADPYGAFRAEGLTDGDYRIHLGKDGHDWVVHGSDWNFYVGPSPSPLAAPTSPNPFAAQLAAMLGAGQVFSKGYPETVSPILGNLLRHTGELVEDARFPRPGTDLGRGWFVGAGAVGSATAYFLTFAGLRFKPSIFDMDCVKIENLDRSPPYGMGDVASNKAEALAAYLTGLGYEAESVPVALDEARRWTDRSPGEPDFIISAANERNVRYQIESLFPPLQIYATTGKQWQATVLRHVPLVDACSCCVFGTVSASTACATAPVAMPEAPEVKVDASLPFLSFAAGILAAAEVAKLPLDGYPFSPNRAFLNTLSNQPMMSAPSHIRKDCVCQGRNAKVHAAMLEGSKYAALSDKPD